MAKKMSGVRNRLRKVVEALRMKQTLFAETINTTPGYLSAVLTGQKSPSERFVRYIAVTYDLPFEWLAWGQGDEKTILDNFTRRAQTIRYANNNPDDPGDDSMDDLISKLQEIEKTAPPDVFKKILGEIEFAHRQHCKGKPQGSKQTG